MDNNASSQYIVLRSITYRYGKEVPNRIHTLSKTDVVSLALLAHQAKLSVEGSLEMPDLIQTAIQYSQSTGNTVYIARTPVSIRAPNMVWFGKKDIFKFLVWFKNNVTP